MSESESSNVKTKKQTDRSRPSPTITSEPSTASADIGGLPGSFETLIGGDLSQATFERHAALLGDPRMSHPMYDQQRASVVRQIQRDFGNPYVQRLVNHIHTKRKQAIQTKLSVGPAGDKYEQEADRTAKVVVRILDLDDTFVEEDQRKQEIESSRNKIYNDAVDRICRYISGQSLVEIMNHNQRRKLEGNQLYKSNQIEPDQHPFQKNHMIRAEAYDYGAIQRVIRIKLGGEIEEMDEVEIDPYEEQIKEAARGAGLNEEETWERFKNMAEEFDNYPDDNSYYDGWANAVKGIASGGQPTETDEGDFSLKDIVAESEKATNPEEILNFAGTSQEDIPLEALRRFKKVWETMAGLKVEGGNFNDTLDKLNLVGLNLIKRFEYYLDFVRMESNVQSGLTGAKVSQKPSRFDKIMYKLHQHLYISEIEDLWTKGLDKCDASPYACHQNAAGEILGIVDAAIKQVEKELQDDDSDIEDEGADAATTTPTTTTTTTAD